MSNREQSLPLPLDQPALVPWRAQPRLAPPRRLLAGLGIAALVILAPPLMQTPEGQHALIGLALVTVALPVVLRSPRLFAPVVLTYVCLLGGLRRWLIPIVGWPANDPLLLVGPAIALASCALLMGERRLPLDSRLARLVFSLMAVMVVEIVNPLQGGLSVGLAGALFCLVPLLWYCVGRGIGTPQRLGQALTLTTGIAVAAALYGLYQTWFGFFASERLWIDLNHDTYAALNAGGGAIRAFSVFSSASEYAEFLGIGIVLLWTAWLQGRRLALIPIPLLCVALFLESERGAVLETLFACALVWAVQGRTIRAWVPRGLLALLIAVAGLAWGLNGVKQAEVTGATANLVNHQVNGLLNPFDQQQSTAGGHLAMLASGVLAGITNPIGRGLGATTIAGNKFGDQSDNTEIDFSNMFVSLGVLGGLIYLAVIVAVWATTLRLWQKTRRPEILAVLGILAMSFGSWLNGSQYAACMLIWFCIGNLDRRLSWATTEGKP